MIYTAQQVANLKFAAEVVWPSVPEKNVSAALGHFTEGSHARTDCQTVACGGGWLCRHPFFQAQGAYINDEGFPRLLHYRELTSPEVAEALFGDRNLFMLRGGHGVDASCFLLSDHEVFAARLRWNLERAKA